MPKAATVLSGEIPAAPRRRTTGVLWASAAAGAMALAAVGFFAISGGTAGGTGSHIERLARGAGTGGALEVPVVPVGPLPGAVDAAVPEGTDAAVVPPVANDVPDAGEAPPVELNGAATTKRGKVAKLVKAPPPGGDTPVPPPPPPADVPNPGRRAYEEGRALFLSGQYAHAITKYREAERLGFGGPVLYKSLGQAYSRVGNTAAMCEAYRRVLRGNPNDLSARGIVDGQCH
jgi:tetratricopeptide (TPR) repeat protein